jgi:hypothetical protein
MESVRNMLEYLRHFDEMAPGALPTQVGLAYKAYFSVKQASHGLRVKFKHDDTEFLIAKIQQEVTWLFPNAKRDKKFVIPAHLNSSDVRKCRDWVELNIKPLTLLWEKVIQHNVSCAILLKKANDTQLYSDAENYINWTRISNDEKINFWRVLTK